MKFRGFSSIVDWIILKRDGGQLSGEQLRALVEQFMRGQITDYQLSAWLMAVFFRGLSLDETVALTEAMLRSGQQLAHPRNRQPKVDKHSTGGVGDKISLCLAPLVAACGVAVPMISGRGLGHTGGTLDKLEAIPGYQTRLTVAKFQNIVRRIGVSIIGQTEQLAPADARMYALRDVTGTVPSMPLIAASILSKKLAAGLDALVMDIKVGHGAFMPDRKAARALSELLRQVGGRLGLPVRGLLTDMSTPIGTCIGNALEAREAILVLTGGGPVDTRELTLALGIEMLQAAGVERSAPRARQQLEAALASGAAAERFERMIALHGGDAGVVADPSRLPRTRHHALVLAARAGYVSGVDALALGELAVAMGAGRTRADQDVDPRVGIELCCGVGLWVERGEPLARLHCSSPRRAPEWQARARQAFTLSEQKPRARSRVLERFG
ncbi:MAG TPA: thymidine phosphorylase [Polyangiaceae bacterium]|nr:thymidine phosphorylase [Polyangiaceae bacterium]